MKDDTGGADMSELDAAGFGSSFLVGAEKSVSFQCRPIKFPSHSGSSLSEKIKTRSTHDSDWALFLAASLLQHQDFSYTLVCSPQSLDHSNTPPTP